MESMVSMAGINGLLIVVMSPLQLYKQLLSSGINQYSCTVILWGLVCSQEDCIIKQNQYTNIQCMRQYFTVSKRNVSLWGQLSGIGVHVHQLFGLYAAIHDFSKRCTCLRCFGGWYRQCLFAYLLCIHGLFPERACGVCKAAYLSSLVSSNSGVWSDYCLNSACN